MATPESQNLPEMTASAEVNKANHGRLLSCRIVNRHETQTIAKVSTKYYRITS